MIPNSNSARPGIPAGGSPSAPGGGRYYGLDALRGTMMLLGIVLHGVGFYLVAPPAAMPVPTDRNTSYVADVLFHCIHSFRMPTFFVLAGFFAALLVEKRGLGGMYRDRLARIVAPFLAAVAVIMPPTLLFAVDYMLAARYGVQELIPQRALVDQLGAELRAAGFPAGKPSVGHLWFLYYLCWFYLLVPLARWLVAVTRPREAAITAYVGSPRAAIVLLLVTALTLWPFAGGQVHEGFLFLEPHPPTLAYYGVFFVAGYALEAHRAALPSLARMAPAAALAALVLFPLSLYASHLDHPADAVSHLAAVFAHAACTWALAYAFVGGALRLFDRESPWTLYASQSAYWVYLVHMIPVCAGAWLLAPLDLPAVTKALLVMAFATVVCFTSYHYLVQGTWVGRFLHGKRFHLDWPWRAAR